MPMVVTATMAEVSALIGALAWPIVALTICLIFRGQIVGLLRRDDVEIRGPGGFGVSAKGQDAAARAIVQASVDKDAPPVSTEAAESGVANVARDVEVLGRSPRVLWVDDRPSNNRREAAALTSLGMHVSLSISTEDALTQVARNGPFDVIISDMGRPPDAEAGYTLLESLRSRGIRTPFVIYAASRAPEHFNKAVERGAVGVRTGPTN